jgi:two-component system cell cycle response regulator DivK
MDINMPGMNGFDAAGKIKTLRPGLPILAQTAFALDEDKEKYGGNFDGYVTKPIKADALKAKIGAFIKNFSM